MPEALELPSLMAAAASAAGDDDVPTAATLLRQALDLQTATLGPDHPDIATTLNNLALMLEKLGHVREAGQCYRRAHAIAAAALGSDDPVVQVSRANLDAFRATYAQAVEGDDVRPVNPEVWGNLGDFPAGRAEPAPAASDAHAAEPTGADRQATDDAEMGSAAGPGTGAVRAPWRSPDSEPAGSPGSGPGPAVTPERDPEEELAIVMAPAAPQPAPRRAARPAGASAPAPATRPVVTFRRGRSRLTAVLVVAVLLAGAVAWWSGRPEAPAPTSRPDAGGADTAAGPAATPSASPPATPASATASETAPSPHTVAPDARTAPPGGIPSPPPAATNTTRPAPISATRPAATGAPGVAVAQLCAALSRARNPWACEPAGAPVRSDAVYYYTRVRSTRDMTIRHRWSRDGRIVQDVRLGIRTNPTDGFRTFSRQTVRGFGAGTWVVALLGPDGAVLDEQRFEVR